jgi:hypothetical protein
MLASKRNDTLLREIGFSEISRKWISKGDYDFAGRTRTKDEPTPPNDLLDDFDSGKKLVEKEFKQH